jgi:hypothetical protein
MNKNDSEDQDDPYSSLIEQNENALEAPKTETAR